MACLVCFAVIAVFVVFRDFLFFDIPIQDFLISVRRDVLTILLTVITYSANWQFISILCMLLLIWPKTTIAYGLPLAGGAILSSIAYKLLKSLFLRPRPDLTLHLIDQGGFSFPSGHSMTGLLFYGLLILLLRRQLLTPASGDSPTHRKKTAAFLLTVFLTSHIFLIGLSRIYLGVHYPSDVIGGWAFGGFLLILLSSFVLRRDGESGSKEAREEAAER